MTTLGGSSKNNIVTYSLDSLMLVRIIIIIDKDRNKTTAPNTIMMIKLLWLYDVIPIKSSITIAYAVRVAFKYALNPFTKVKYNYIELLENVISLISEFIIYSAYESIYEVAC